LESWSDRENKFFEGVREKAGQAHTRQMEESTERNSKLIVAADQTAPDVARAIHSLSGPLRPSSTTRGPARFAPARGRWLK
jgi:hypothetical protein